jgi:hypothetical protein
MAAAVAAKDQAIAARKAQYPDENMEFVVRNKCAYEAAKVLRPFSSYPDLLIKAGPLAPSLPPPRPPAIALATRQSAF